MKFDTPVTTDPIDQLKVIGKPTDRIDGPLKTTGRATYAYEWHDPRSNLAYGYVVGSATGFTLEHSISKILTMKPSSFFSSTLSFPSTLISSGK